MGTRGLLGLIIKGKRHATYNQINCYPNGLGRDIVKFLLSLKPEEYSVMTERINEITWVKESDTPSKEVQEKYDALGFADLHVSNQSLNDWYCLLRNLQGVAVLPAIKDGKVKHLVESIDFISDDLFCAWSYFIDFEEQKFTTYRKGDHVVEEVTFEDLQKKGERYMMSLQAEDD